MFPTRLRPELTKSGTGDRVGQAIATAAAKTGVDFGYLLSQAKVESGLDPKAQARTSSATGLYQFVEQTWLGTVKQHGAGHGLGWAADAIHKRSDGRYAVSDDALRDAILDLRNQPEAAAAMAAEFASDNRVLLEERLGRGVDSVDLYLAHFLGPEGAAEFLSMHDADPSQAAAPLFPAAARANRSIFFGADGTARSLGEIRTQFAAKLGAGGATPLPPAPMTQAESRFRPKRLEPGTAPMGPIARPSVHYARVAYQMLSGVEG